MLPKRWIPMPGDIVIDTKNKIVCRFRAWAQGGCGAWCEIDSKLGPLEHYVWGSYLRKAPSYIAKPKQLAKQWGWA